ncbi:MAG: rhomboid family intramembrane serine protease [Bacteroidota bacterium]
MAFPPNQYQAPSGFAAIPPIVKNLLIINGLVFLAQQIPVLAEPLAVWGMLWPAGTPELVPQNGELLRVPDFWPWQPITSAFMHGGLGHIFFNMFGLWMFGGVVEQTLGSKRFLGFYAACVIGAGLLQLVVTSSPFWLGASPLPMPVPTLGASGGVLGVLAAFATLYPDQKIFLLFLPVPIPAKWFVLGYAAIDLFSGVTSTGSGIAHFAHLGGMLAGFLMIQYWRGRLPIRPSARSI